MDYAIAIDFDGTIVENKFPNIGKMKPNAKYAIDWLQSRGYRVYLWTCRYGETLQNAVDFLQSNAIVLQDPQEWKGIKKVAQFYIDDRSVPCFLGWLSTMYIISQVEGIQLPEDFNWDEMDDELDMQHNSALAFLNECTKFYPKRYFN